MASVYRGKFQFTLLNRKDETECYHGLYRLPEMMFKQEQDLSIFR